MTMTAQRDPSLVVIQLTGGNDAMNTVVPYTNGIYQDSRKAICLTEDEVIDINGSLGFHPNLGPFKSIWDEGNMAIVNGIGYPKPNRSHFRSMDIWHTAETVEIAPNGWLGRTIREIDPGHENVIAGVNFGRGLPRALHCKGVPVASVGNLATYGLMPDITDAPTRELALDIFTRMYGPAEGRDAILEAIGETGMSAYLGADILRTAPRKYKSSIEYADSPIGNALRDAAQVMFADVGTRIFYTQHGSYDTHAGELANHCEADGRVVDGRWRLLRRPGGARARERRGGAGVLGVRAADQRQRLGDGPRVGRHCVRDGRPREGRVLRRVPVAGPA